jgi:hypothetical protein
VTLIQRHFSTSIQLSNPTKIQRLFNVDGQLKLEVREMSSHGTVDSMFLLYDIIGEVREMRSPGTVDIMFILYDILDEVSEMNRPGTVDSMFIL